ncbi:MAG: hypothetical protein ACJAVI_002848 [Candidatus Azotimanducaceae bacterium]|jgi:hypothetical protein
MRFMHDDSTEADVELLDQAYAMELHVNDLMVRRRLVQMIENHLRAAGENLSLSDEDLKKLYQQKIETYTRQERVSFTHAFVSQDRYAE